MSGTPLALTALAFGNFTTGLDMTALNAAVADLPQPSVVYVIGGCVPEGLALAATGTHPTPQTAPLNENSPVRTASITKTFTAATIMRLWEQQRLDLDTPMSELASASLMASLVKAGYDVEAITVRHLLNQTSGLYDHASDARYQQMWLDNPDHHWTRQEQVELSASFNGPLHSPGTRFAYADTGYIILGDIIEQVTGQPLHQAVREQLKLEQFGLNSTWWEVAETAPSTSQPKARQLWKGQDIDRLHGSLDMYGGGGLIMSARDLAVFFAALFEDQVFDHPRTLSEMTRFLPHEGGASYRLGIMATPEQPDWRNKGFWHSGFWGTVTYYIPAKRLAVSGVTADQSGYPALHEAVKEVIAALPCQWEGGR